jgi:hypothetical protein
VQGINRNMLNLKKIIMKTLELNNVETLSVNELLSVKGGRKGDDGDLPID